MTLRNQEFAWRRSNTLLGWIRSAWSRQEAYSVSKLCLRWHKTLYWRWVQNMKYNAIIITVMIVGAAVFRSTDMLSKLECAIKVARVNQWISMHTVYRNSTLAYSSLELAALHETNLSPRQTVYCDLHDVRFVCRSAQVHPRHLHLQYPPILPLHLPHRASPTPDTW